MLPLEVASYLAHLTTFYMTFAVVVCQLIPDLVQQIQGEMEGLRACLALYERLVLGARLEAITVHEPSCLAKT